MAVDAVATDRLDGVPVVERIDIEALDPGLHRFWLAAGWRSMGQRFHVPVLVAKGPVDGPRLLLTAGVHGDELNGIAVIHGLVDALGPADLTGTVIALPGINISGMEHHSRQFHATNDGGGTYNLNRLMPGRKGVDAAADFARDVWLGAIDGNADLAIDLHTQTRGNRYPLFVFADYRNLEAKRIAELLEPDAIKIDKGIDGTVETELIRQGVPAVTFEVGDPKVYQDAYVDRAIKGVQNVMRSFGLLAGPVEPQGTETFVGNEYATVLSRTSGFVDILVDLGDSVIQGQEVAVQRNAFGDVVDRFTAPFAGSVLSVASDPLREPGATVVRILRLSNDPACAEGC